MSSSQTKTRGQSFWSEGPSKYDRLIGRPYYDDERYRQRLIDTLERPELQFNVANDYTATLLARILPMITEGREPATLEFLNYRQRDGWGAERQLLRGAIVRDAHLNVLLYVKGALLDDTLTAAVRECLFEQFGIKPDDQQRIINCAFDKAEYSVMIQLS